MSADFLCGLGIGIMISIALIIFWASRQNMVISIYRKENSQLKCRIDELRARNKEVSGENYRLRQRISTIQPVKNTHSKSKEQGSLSIPISYTNWEELEDAQ